MVILRCTLGLPWWLSSKEFTCNARDSGSVPGLETSPGEGNDNPLQYSCLGNPMDRGLWQATVHGVTKRVRHDWVTKQQGATAVPWYSRGIGSRNSHTYQNLRIFKSLIYSSLVIYI